MPETRKTFGDVSIWPNGDFAATVEIGRPPDNFLDAELITSLADAPGLTPDVGCLALVDQL
jgi:hypothetical protein